uniref:Mitochondrial YP011 n=1 Tax=Starmerella bombicola TaxID=75736 RepID=A0A6M8Y3I8_STABO|nr:mitochondrial YP011 [Starmerella bombicola]UJH94564.1 YPR011 [Starmerella bombicola]
MWQEEGWRGMFRGNGLNCVRVVPYSAVQFCTYTSVKAALGPTLANEWQGKVLSGMAGGVVSVVATYPMDLVRTRLSIQTAQISSKLKRADIKKPPGMWHLLVQMYRTEGGVASLYRGLIPTTLGIAPYVGINFASYEYFKDNWLRGNSMLAGAISGGLAQSITYPFDILRRRFQVKTLSQGSLGYSYDGTWDAFRQIVAKEGWKGLYKGYVPHVAKVVPSMAASFWTFETVKKALNSL